MFIHRPYWAHDVFSIAIFWCSIMCNSTHADTSYTYSVSFFRWWHDGVKITAVQVVKLTDHTFLYSRAEEGMVLSQIQGKSTQ